MQFEEERWYEKVEDKVEEYCGNNYKHGAICVGVGISHFWEAVHECTETQSYEDYENKYEVGENGLEGLNNWFHIDHFHEEV